MQDKYALTSLFSGAGGMDLGFKMEGSFRILLANDVLSSPARTYAENFGCSVIDVGEFNHSAGSKSPVYLLGDVAEIDFSRINDEIDVVVGGPPCQDFSIVRGAEKERRGLKSRRGRLYAHFVRALIHLQPKVFVFENVPGLKSANNGIAYETILKDFSKLNLRWDEIRRIVGNSFSRSVKNYLIVFSGIVDSSHLGVPQKRKRLIIIGVREDLFENDLTALSEVKLKAESTLSGRGSIFRKYPMTPLEVFEGLALPELTGEYRRIMEDYKNVDSLVGTDPALKWRERVWKKLSFDAVKDYLMLNGGAPQTSGELDRAFEEHSEILKKLGYYKNRLDGKSFPDGSNEVPSETEDVLARLRMIPPGENHLFVRGTQWEVEGRGISLIYRRLHPLKPSYTVVAYGGGGTWGYHYRRSRSKLTDRERARLQTFPDFFMFEGSSAEIRAQIGEAVPPLLGKKIAQTVKAVLNEVG